MARNCCELYSLEREALEGLAERHHDLSALMEVDEPPSAGQGDLDDVGLCRIEMLQV